MSLSTAGEYFLVHARRLLAALKDADDAMARFKRLEHGLLTIGMVSTAKYFVPQLLARFHEEHPGIDVRLRVVGNREQLVALMHARRGRPVGDGPAAEGDRTPAPKPSPRTRWCSSRRPGTRCCAAGRMPVSALAPYPFIVREHGSGTRAAMEEFFAEHRFEPRIAMEMSSNETIKQAVMAGMGLSFLSLHTMGLELRSGLLQMLDVEGTPVMRMWNVVHLQSKLLSPAAEAFRYFMLEQGEAHLLAHDTPLLGAAAAALRAGRHLLARLLARQAFFAAALAGIAAARRGSSRSRSRSSG